MFSEQGLKDKLKYKTKQMNVDFNALMKMYVFERLLIRISNSSYKNNIILKGGILLCSLYGLDNRVTQDIDLSMVNSDLKKDTLNSILFNIMKIDLEDGIHFTLKNIEPINAQMEYEGYRARIEYRFDKIHDVIYIDFATGDFITPKPITYRYPQILDDEGFDMLAYNIETIIAEKLETVLKRGVANSRMKDYYDLYYISTHRHEIVINEGILKTAISNTFKKRSYKYDRNHFENIKNSSILKNVWIRYSRDNSLGKNIKYEDVINKIEQYIELIN